MTEVVDTFVNIDHVFAMMAKLSNDVRALTQTMSNNQTDVDEYLSLTTPGTVLTLYPNFRTPIVVDQIMAVFPTNSTSAVIQLGNNRTINISNLAAGVFSMDLRMQLEYEDIRRLTIAPAGLAHFEIMGHLAPRKADKVK